MPVTTNDLMRGAWFSLEQAGLLLRDAVRLYEAGSLASGVALAMFAREELGRHRILVGLFKKAKGGATVTVDDVEAACRDHVEKQRKGSLSKVLVVDRDTVLGKAMWAAMKAKPGTPEWDAAHDAVNAAADAKAKRAPDERHRARMQSLYVDVTDAGSWDLPRDEWTQMTACFAISDAANDYAVRQDDVNLHYHDPDFMADVDAWAGKPALPPPSHPSLPSTETPEVM